jgi:hypothetical protein
MSLQRATLEGVACGRRLQPPAITLGGADA